MRKILRMHASGHRLWWMRFRIWRSEFYLKTSRLLSAKSRQVWRYRRKGSDRRIWRACLKTGGRGRANCRISEWCTGWTAGIRSDGVCKDEGGGSRTQPADCVGAGGQVYYAVTDEVPEAGKGQFTDYLLRDGRTNTSAVVESSTPGAKRADAFLRGFRAEKRARRSSDSTGNRQTSQIRVQLAHAGMPIVGDRKYNFKENMNRRGNRSPLFVQIGFRHPKTRRNLAFEIDNLSIYHKIISCAGAAHRQP